MIWLFYSEEKSGFFSFCLLLCVILRHGFLCPLPLLLCFHLAKLFKTHALYVFIYYFVPTLQGLADTKIPGAGSPMSNRSFHMAAGARRQSQGQLSRTYSPASLHRSVSQLLNLYDKKTFDESPWDAIIHNHRTTGRGLVRAPAPLGCHCASPASDLSVLLESW